MAVTLMLKDTKISKLVFISREVCALSQSKDSAHQTNHCIQSEFRSFLHKIE